MQEQTRPFKAKKRNIDHEIDARDLLESFAEMIRADIDCVSHPGEGEFTSRILVNEILGFPDFDRLSPIPRRREGRTALGAKVI